MNWWTKYPRKVGTPQKMVVKDQKEFLDTYNRLNGNVDKLYVSLYQCDENGHYDNVVVDVVGHDIDWDDKYNSMVELHNKLMADGHMHQVMYSTGGFWIYTMVKPVSYPKEIAKGKIAALQDFLLEGTSLKFGRPKESAIDISVRGDVERLTRMPTSFDRTRKRYVIFLTDDDIIKGMDHIMNLSTNCDKERRFKVYTFGTEITLDPEAHVAKTIPRVYMSEFNPGEYETSALDIPQQHLEIFNSMPLFMQQWLTTPEYGTFKARFYLTVYMKERGFTLTQTETFLKPFFEKMPRTDHHKNNWVQYHEVAHTAENVYKRNDIIFPNYRTLYSEGLCPYELLEKFGEFSNPLYKKK